MALRARYTAGERTSTDNVAQQHGLRRTKTEAVYPLTLLEEAVDLAHLLQSRLRHALVRQDLLDFFSHGLYPLWISSESVEGLGEALVIMQTIKYSRT